MQEIYIGNGTTEYCLHSLTSSVASITFRGLEGLENPEVRLDVYDNPGIRGQTVAQALDGGRLVTLTGALHPSPDATDKQLSYLQQRAALIAATTPTYDQYGRVEPLTLRLIDLDDTEYHLSVYKARPLKAARELPTRNEWQLQLLNASGVIESATASSATMYLPQDTGVLLGDDGELDVPFLLGASTGGSVSVTNAGSAIVMPTIVIYGPITNPVITNATTGLSLSLSHTLLQGESITINMDRRTVVQGQTTNRMGVITAGSRFWGLQPGENTIQLRAATYDSGYATMSFKSAFIGI